MHIITLLYTKVKQTLIRLTVNGISAKTFALCCIAELCMSQLQETLLMVGPYGDAVQYEAESSLVLTSEIDGVHILTAEKREFLRRVPDALEDISRIGSTSPGRYIRYKYHQVQHLTLVSLAGIDILRSQD